MKPISAVPSRRLGVLLLAALLTGCATTPQTPPTPQSQIEQAWTKYTACHDQNGDRPEFKPIAAHFVDRRTQRHTVAQMADETAPTAEEAKLWAAMREGLGPCITALNDIWMKIRPDIGAIQMDAAQQYEAISLLLVERKITWGEMARRENALGDDTRRRVLAANGIATVPTQSNLPEAQYVPEAGPPPQASTGHSEIALRKQGGAFTVPVTVNGAMTLDFMVDSGAADVSVPADVVLTLIRTGTISRGDFLGNRTYMLADGSTAPSPTFRIRTLKVGNREIRNVVASITPVNGSLLLGQSFLSHFASWSIDNHRGTLVLE